MTAPGPQPAPVSPDLECTVCQPVSSPHGVPATGATPGQAPGEPPALYARWVRADFKDATDVRVGRLWHAASESDRAFWTDLVATQDAMAGLATEMHERAGAPVPPDAVDGADRIVRAQVLHEYASRIRLALGPEAS